MLANDGAFVPVKLNNVLSKGPNNAKTEVLKKTYKRAKIKYGTANFPIGLEKDNSRKYVFIKYH